MIHNPIGFIIPELLLAAIIGIRVKKSFGFYRYWRAFPIFRAGACVLILSVVVSFGILYHPETLFINAIGVILGVGLGYLGVRNATIEKRDAGIYYRTHSWIEIGILIVIFIRLTIRLYEIWASIRNLPPNQALGQVWAQKDPLTGIIVSVFSTYYICYFIYISIRSRRIRKSGNS